jgi:hypothetical protein
MTTDPRDGYTDPPRLGPVPDPVRTGRRQLQCPVCWQRFSKEHKYTLHYRVKHDPGPDA